MTADGDFRDYTVDVVDAGKRGPRDFRLRLGADTRGTRDETVKFIGVRTAKTIGLGSSRVSVELDWNDQPNGSYLSAAVILSPHVTVKNPLAAGDWLKVEYVGVPPGQNARMVIALRTAGREQLLSTEGWPTTSRVGRKIGVQEITIINEGSSFRVLENGQLVYEARTGRLPFDAAYLYLQMSTHSNYPLRVIYFDNVRVRSGE